MHEKRWGWREASFVYLALAGGILFVLTTGLITDFGYWYSSHLAYRSQTEAFLHGRIAVHEIPTGMALDHCWYDGKLQQVWGLGVPAWRFVFEAMAVAVGQPGFPDRLAFLFAFALAGFLLMKALATLRINGYPDSRKTSTGIGLVSGTGALLLLLAFPPFFNVCRTRFEVYEEAAAYAYLYGISLFSGLLIFHKRRTFSLLMILAAFSGFAPLVRPPLVFYGGVTFALSFWMAWSAKFTRRQITAGVLMFLLSLSILFATNWQRFGDPLEFGHSINFSDIRARYATRIENPFRHEPFLPAARELWGALFRVKKFNGGEWYAQKIFPGQSPSPRWREIYFTTYDLIFAGVLVSAWIYGAFALAKGKRLSSCEDPRNLTVAWSLLSTIPLVAFYLHSPALTSRYTIDFGPAFAVALLGLWFRFTSGRVKPTLCVYALFVLCYWFGHTIVTSRFQGGKGPKPAFRQEQVVGYSDRPVNTPPPLPGKYNLKQDWSAIGIPGNGEGWNNHSGQTDAIVTAWVDSPAEITIRVTPVQGLKVAPSYYDCLRAKIGLEELRRISVTVTNDDRIIVFRGPQKPHYRQGVQVFFLAMMPPEFLGRNFYSDLRLLSVEWKKSDAKK